MKRKSVSVLEKNETKKCTRVSLSFSGESFISNADYLSVSTVECTPYTCNFPYQLCMRAAALYKEPSANECRDLPVQCIQAANGGVLPLVNLIRPLTSSKPELGLVVTTAFPTPLGPATNVGKPSGKPLH